MCDSLSSIGKPVDDSMKIFGFLNGLGREYDPITTVIQSSLSRVPALTFNDVISYVQNYDTKLQTYKENTAENPHMAFNTQRSESTPPQYAPSQRGRGHSSYYRGRGRFSSRGQGFSQHQTECRSPGDRPVCQICGRVGHTAMRCYNHFDNNYNTEAFSSLRVSDDTGKEWYPDSGASNHVTSFASGLQQVSHYEGSDAIMVCDGAYLPNTHIGSTTISTSKGKLPLNEVLVFPTMKKSLMFVSKLSDDYPCGVYLDSNKVYVIDLRTQKVVSKN